jgi:Arc/MetJ-type ribon-helix-helix transcriptional regulator
MKNISLRLPDKLLEDIDGLVEEGHYSSRTEALREAARRLLSEQAGMLKGRPVVVSKDDLWREFKEEHDLK